MRILHIEDSATHRAMLAALTASHDVVLIEAADCGAARAAATADAGSIDLVIVDLNLPDGDGLELAAELIAGPLASVPWALATTSPPMSAVIRAGELGFSAILGKPIRPGQLAKLLTKIGAQSGA